jgi:hypothetical protein
MTAGAQILISFLINATVGGLSRLGETTSVTSGVVLRNVVAHILRRILKTCEGCSETLAAGKQGGRAAILNGQGPGGLV